MRQGAYSVLPPFFNPAYVDQVAATDMWNAFILAFVVTAAVSDVCYRRIPRALTTAGLLAGLAFHYWAGGLAGALLACGLGFAVGLALFELNAIGGGDVKLVMALGAMLGFRDWMLAMEASVILAGLIALVRVTRRGILRQTLRNMGKIVVSLVRNGWRAHPEVNLQNPSLVRAPFGVAAALGTLLALVRA